MEGEIHITRRKQSAGEGGEIAAPDWLDYVQSDPELRLHPDNGPHFAEWSVDGGESWLDWSRGEVFTKRPSAAFRRKMVAIARRLNARALSEDGEIVDIPPIPARPPLPSISDFVSGWIGRFRRARPVSERDP